MLGYKIRRCPDCNAEVHVHQVKIMGFFRYIIKNCCKHFDPSGKLLLNSELKDYWKDGY